MKHRSLALLAAGAITMSLLAGCTPPAKDPPKATPLATVAPSGSVVPTIPPTEQSEVATDHGAAGDLVVWTYSLGQFVSSKDSGIHRAGETEDAFPAGTPVVAVRIDLGRLARSDRPSAAGIGFDKSAFEGLDEYAVLNTIDGPAFASERGLPWGPHPADEEWLLANDVKESFVLAWYVPPATPTLTVVVTHPDWGDVSLTLDVPVSTIH